MLIGVPKEVKVHEYRVGLTPESVQELVRAGHRVLVEHDAGQGIGASDEDYRNAGAATTIGPEEIFDAADLLVKVKEPLPQERARLRAGQGLFTYLHLAADRAQTLDLSSSGVIAIAYETVSSPDGRLPLLAPMSEIAGRMSIQAAAHYLERPQGGRGVLLSGATGAPPARVLVLGAGVVGTNAAQVALAMGASVVVLNRTAPSLKAMLAQLDRDVETGLASERRITKELVRADAVIGAVLVPGARAPRLIARTMLSAMKPGSVIVDVSIDQGGCAETSRPTDHEKPVYSVDGVLHYCVANMPGAVPRTSTYALNRATLPYVKLIAERGLERALRDDSGLRDGLNVCKGWVTRREVAEAHGCEYRQALQALAG